MNQYVLPNLGMFSVAGTAAWLGVDEAAITALCWLLLADYVTGIAKSLRLKKPITSRIGIVGIMSKIMTFGVVLIVALVAQGTGVDTETYVTWAVSLLVINEAYSALSNIYTVQTGKELPEWSVVEMMGRKLKEIGEKIFYDGR